MIFSGCARNISLKAHSTPKIWNASEGRALLQNKVPMERLERVRGCGRGWRCWGEEALGKTRIAEEVGDWVWNRLGDV